MKLQVLIAAYGPDALERIAVNSHPIYPDVEYLVNWQNHQDREIHQSLKDRTDFKIFRDKEIGLCNGRNSLIRHSSAEWLLISDDDVRYTEENLRNLLKAFEEFPDSAVLTFKYDSGRNHKVYPDEGFNLAKAPKGYFVSSIEMALNRKVLYPLIVPSRGALFNPAFGVNGSLFGSGEEDVLLHKIIKSDFKGRYVPTVVASHASSSTSERNALTRGFIETKGAVFLYIKPASWPLRMLAHARKASSQSGDNRIGFLRYCHWWLSGALKAHKHKVFK